MFWNFHPGGTYCLIAELISILTFNSISALFFILLLKSSIPAKLLKEESTRNMVFKILIFESNSLSSFIGTFKPFHKAYASRPDCFIDAAVTQHL